MLNSRLFPRLKSELKNKLQN